MAHLSTVKAGSLGTWSLIIGLSLDVRGIVIFWLGCVCIDVVALILASVVRGSGPRQVHWYLDVVICGSWRIGGVILWFLLLLLLLSSLLGSSSPSLWSELILVLSECVVDPPGVGDSSSGSNELNHLSSFGYVDCPSFVLIVILWNWEFDDFVEYAWR
jgi:hypothetical protein